MDVGDVLIRAHCILTAYLSTPKKCDAPEAVRIAHPFHAAIRPSEQRNRIKTRSFNRERFSPP